MNFSLEQLTKAKAAKSAEELLAFAKAEGIALTEEEAAKYFTDLHKEGELSDNELDNVAGGSQCVEGSIYSSDPPYYLITTVGNHCSRYLHDEDSAALGVDNTCYTCVHSSGFAPMYCKERTATNDPYR